MLLLFYIIPEWDWCFTYWIYIRVYNETFVAYTNITESSKNITCQGSKSYQDYRLKLRTKSQNKWTKKTVLLFLAWLTFIAFKHILASFSLERRWCSALIGGSRTAPCAGWKDQFGNDVTVPSTQWADVVSCWSISLVSGLPRVSLCFSLFGKCIFKLGKALLHCLPPSWTLWIQGFSSVDINDQGLQVPLADIFIVIKQPFCYFQQYKFFSLWCDRDTPAFFGKGDQMRCLGNWPPYTLPLSQH